MHIWNVFRSNLRKHKLPSDIENEINAQSVNKNHPRKVIWGSTKEPPWGKALQMRFLWPDISKEKQFQFAHAATQWGNTTNVTCVKLCDLGIALLRSTCLSTQERNLNIDQFQWWFSARAFVALNRRKKWLIPFLPSLLFTCPRQCVTCLPTLGRIHTGVQNAPIQQQQNKHWVFT